MAVYKKIHIGDVLSVTTEINLSPTGITGIFDFVYFMTGKKFYAHQVQDCRAAADKCIPSIFEQHPQLKEIDASTVNKKNYKKWLDEQIAKYGEYFEIKPLM